MTTDIALPRLLRLGGGSLSAVGEVVAALGVRRPLIVTDAYLVGTGVVARASEIVTDAGVDVAVFAETVPDPTTESLQAGLDAVRRHRADSVIGFGGGSPMDTAKALAVLAVAGGQMRDFKAPRQYAGDALPVIAIPTTAGSGSEATRFTVITDSACDEKMLCPGTSFLPAAAIVDYELTMSMPPRLTADTGVDALTHAIEAYVSRKANAFSDSLCLTAINTVGKHLRAAYRDGQNRPAREAMMLASMQAGMAFSNSSVALVHGMSRPLGAHFQVAHGLSNAMLFTAVTEYSIGGASQRYAQCARAMGVATDATPDPIAAGALVDELELLCTDVEVPTPAAYGIERAAWDGLLPLMAEQALASGSPANNPLVPDADQICEIYRTIYAGPV